MGILINFASDEEPAVGLVEQAVLAVMESAHARDGLLTFHAPFTTECAQCLNVLCTHRNSASESTCEVCLAQPYPNIVHFYLGQPAVSVAIARCK